MSTINLETLNFYEKFRENIFIYCDILVKFASSIFGGGIVVLQAGVVPQGSLHHWLRRVNNPHTSLHVNDVPTRAYRFRSLFRNVSTISAPQKRCNDLSIKLFCSYLVNSIRISIDNEHFVAYVCFYQLEE